MCGIVGMAFAKSSKLKDIHKMLPTLSLRGPDDFGVWKDENDGVALGHRRLSILDLSPAGHQPMFSSSKRFVITYNGEVYNYQAIQKELIKKGYKFNGSSDTEVLLAAFEEWGVEKSVKKFDGMFGICTVG